MPDSRSISVVRKQKYNTIKEERSRAAISRCNFSPLFSLYFSAQRLCVCMNGLVFSEAQYDETTLTILYRSIFLHGFFSRSPNHYGQSGKTSHCGTELHHLLFPRPTDNNHKNRSGFKTTLRSDSEQRLLDRVWEKGNLDENTRNRSRSPCIDHSRKYHQIHRTPPAGPENHLCKTRKIRLYNRL